MSVNWLNFKSILATFDGLRVAYIDSEGSEIPIDSECEFEEAVRIAKSGNRRLKLLLSHTDSKPLNTVPEVPFKTLADLIEHTAKSSVVNSSVKPLSAEMTSQEPALKENKCQCNGDVPPEWFIKYMKKFKKEVLKELKSDLRDSFHKALEKEKKICKVKGEIIGLPSNKIAIIQYKKKKNVLEKNVSMEERESKLSKKMEKLNPSKYIRLEKLDPKSRQMLEEKRKIMERTYPIPKFERKVDEDIRPKSISFSQNEMWLYLPPNAEFSFTLNFKNNGLTAWEHPWLNCFQLSGLFPKESIFGLQKLRPNQSGFATLSGKVCGVGGLHHFRARFFDGPNRYGPDFICWARVESNAPVENVPLAIFDSLEIEKMAEFPRGLQNDFKVAETFRNVHGDLKKAEFSAARKKIEDNISEIEKRLRYLDFIPSTSAKKGIRRVKAVAKAEGERGDLNKNSERKEKNPKGVPQQSAKGSNFNPPTSKKKASEENDEGDRVKQNVEQAQGSEVEGSDSEMSLVILSEDEDFSVVSLRPKAPSPAVAADEDEDLSNVELSASEKGKVDKSGGQQLPTEKELSDSGEVFNVNEIRQCTCSNKNRLPPFGEEVPKSKSKKIKPSSSEYCFTSADLTPPTYRLTPENESHRFRFTGNREESKSPSGRCPEGVFVKTFGRERLREESNSPSGRSSESMFYKVTDEIKEEMSQKEEEIKGQMVATTDYSGNVIYAVSTSGCCFPVEDLWKSESHWPAPEQNTSASQGKRRVDPSRRGRRYEHFVEVPAVNVLPKGLMNGASNVASYAFSTAKSVINNLFATEETDPMKAHSTSRRQSCLPQMAYLLEMGFTNVKLNQELLMKYNNDVIKVLEVLLASGEPPPF